MDRLTDFRRHGLERTERTEESMVEALDARGGLQDFAQASPQCDARGLRDVHERQGTIHAGLLTQLLDLGSKLGILCLQPIPIGSSGLECRPIGLALLKQSVKLLSATLNLLRETIPIGSSCLERRPIGLTLLKQSVKLLSAMLNLLRETIPIGSSGLECMPVSCKFMLVCREVLLEAPANSARQIVTPQLLQTA
jgi:hypothetical protein